MDDDATALLFVGWFCPYSQRAWIASGLSTLKVHVDRRQIELDREKEPRYMLLTGELVGLTPMGAKPGVPTLQMGEHLLLNDSMAVACTLLGPPTSDELKKAQHWDARICSGFYGALKDKDSIPVWEASVEELEEALAERRFLSGEKPGLLDCVVFPFLYRAVAVRMLEHYRGKAPKLGPRTQQWLERMRGLEAVKRTLPKDADITGFSKRLQDAYHAYAQGRRLMGLVPRERDDPVDENLPEELRVKWKTSD